ncbi:MAG TPA: EF-Tu/IF-2/RF-3 family GTPase [Thermoplasmata archaeon]|nr:EF-Tu/IF-2/RF-3 family GTPase [Thermoplasmata archaeon]
MSRSVTVAVVGARGVAAELGKKGTQSDLTLYNSARDGHATTLVEPTHYPEKFAPLPVALSMADRTVLVVAELSREVAETVATVDLFSMPVELLLGPAVGEREVHKAFKGTRIESAASAPLDLPKLRADLETWDGPPDSAGPTLVPIDHAFPVKGVGAVALGVVRRGTLKAHDRLTLFPTGKVVEVRSIQVHDVEVREAGVGERVGVALKGVEADELERGQTLAPEGALSVATEFRAPFERPCPYYRGRIDAGAPFQLLAGLELVPVRLSGSEGGVLSFDADRPVAFEPGQAGYLCDPSASPGPRIAGRVRLSQRT